LNSILKKLIKMNVLAESSTKVFKKLNLNRTIYLA